ncbi:MAG TPA: hypothetical protein VHG53_00190 [Candidatus Limnocylindria bacterium]|nr:hypothetical protein [Candidatus Limnocylindria bacterium]
MEEGEASSPEGQVTSQEFANARALRILAVVSLSSLAALILWEPHLRFIDRAAAAAFVVFGNLAFFGFGYRREPGVAKLQRLRAQLESLDGQIKERDREVQAANAATQEVLSRAELERRRIDGCRSELHSNETGELRTALANSQREHIDAYLRSIPIDWASIPGIGPANRATLQGSGIKTAADVHITSLRGIPGIGLTRRMHLYAWRGALEPNATAAMPRALAPTVEGQIRASCRAKMVGLDTELREIVTRSELESEQLRERARTGLQSLVGLRSEKERLERERTKLGRVTFATYARRVIFLR